MSETRTEAQVIQDLQRRVTELESRLNPQAVEPPDNDWPQAGDIFWSLNHYGDVEKFQWMGGSSIDQKVMEHGAIFRTKAEAMRRAEAMRVQAELRAMPGRRSFSEKAWCICDDGHNSNQFMVDDGFAVASMAIAGVWFKTRGDALRALDTVGQNRLRIWLADYLQMPSKEPT